MNFQDRVFLFNHDNNVSSENFDDFNAHRTKLAHFGFNGIFFDSEHDESLSNVTLDSLLLDSEHIESNSLCKWSALTDSDDITNSGSREHWREVSWQVVMSLLKSIVLFDVMQVVSSQNYSSVHLV